MIRIAIVDDDAVVQEHVRKQIKKILGEDKEIQIDCFGDGESILQEMRSGIKFHILLADIEMQPMHGIELGKRVIRESPDTYLVYLTAYPTFATDSYKLEAYQYILKEDMQKRLPEIIKRLVFKLKEEENGYRIIDTSTEVERLYYKNIILMQKEKNRKYVQYVTANRTYRERITLDDVLRAAQGQQFVRVGRSLAVNLTHITKLKEDMIFLDNGDQIEISRNRMREVKEQISTFWRRN